MHNRRFVHRLGMAARLVAAIGFVTSSAVLRAEESVDPNAELTFERDIRPILRAHCFDCHGGSDVKGKLDLRLRRLMLQGGESGPAIDPGSPASSYLLDRVRAGEMPPGQVKLTPKEILILENWVTAGAKTAREEPEQVSEQTLVTPEDRAFWSFRPLAHSAIPATTQEERARTPIDAFLLAKLREKGMHFSTDADRLTLLRRAALDLTGLPPEPGEVERFLSDESPEAYEKLVDRLLDSPHYGERWGRHWLDAAGYADSQGYDVQDTERDWAYKYRDYVIRSLNADKPFDQFVTEQLAGDELAPGPYSNLTPEVLEKLSATGFLRMAADGSGTGGVDLAVASNQMMADTIKIVSTSLLGLSVGCAQCHDHRYDPIPQEDYYRLRALFEPAINWKNWRLPEQRRVSLYTDADRAKAAEVEAEASKIATDRNDRETKFMAAALEKELEKFDPALREVLRTACNTPGDKRTPEQTGLLSKYPNLNINPGNLYQYNQKASDELKVLDGKIAEVRAKKPVEDFVAILTEEPGNVPETFLFHRGDHRQPKQKVEPGGLTVVALPGERWTPEAKPKELPTSGRRLAFARHLTSGEHPLFGRVIVNRVWMHHFGHGLVGTPADFGSLGEKPTHPELLDWLAREFPRRGWSLKELHRLIMTSTAYRQASHRDLDHPDVDPENLLYSRMSIQRLDAEVVRDRMLQSSGSLFARMFGSPVPVKEDVVGQIVVGIDNKGGANTPGADVPIGSEEFRRSVYIQVRRSRPLAFLRAFDSPVMETNCDRRVSSTASTQALMLMNSEFVLAESARFAQRLRRESGEDLRKQIAHGFELAYSRPASEDEITGSVKFLESQIKQLEAKAAAEPAKTQEQNKAAAPADHGLQALTDFCQALLSSNEFLYVD